MDSKYLLGIEELDAQHDQIEALIVALEESAGDKDQWYALLDDLCEKMRFHFHAEESIMRVFAYPETQEHTRKHQEILKAVESHKDRRLTPTDIAAFRNQPMRLFLEQILSQDKGFATFIKHNKERLGIA